jgi:hypothetical protein
MKITRSNKSKTQTGDVVDLGDHDDFCDIDNYTCDNDTYMKAEGEESIKSFQDCMDHLNEFYNSKTIDKFEYVHVVNSFCTTFSARTAFVMSIEDCRLDWLKRYLYGGMWYCVMCNNFIFLTNFLKIDLFVLYL